MNFRVSLLWLHLTYKIKNTKIRLLISITDVSNYINKCCLLVCQ